jgi:hypothetical protein
VSPNKVLISAQKYLKSVESLSIFSFAFYFFPFILAGDESEPVQNSESELVVVPGIFLFGFADRAQSLR